MLLPDLARDIEKLSIFHTTSTRAAPALLRLDLIRSEDQHTRLQFGLCISAIVYQEAMRFEALSALEEDLDHLLKIGDEDATACREAPIFDKYLD
jgi:hypothetical protein